MASSNPSHKQEHGVNENRSEQFITARNEQGQFVPMGARDYGRDYGASGSKDYGQSSSKDYGQSVKDSGKDYASTANKSEDKHSDVGNMLRHIESLEAKLVNKDKQLHEATHSVEKFSARTREGMQSALDSLMKKWMDACETKDDKCKEQFKHGMEKLVQNSAEENGVWQMIVAASALHERHQ